jgi:K+-transporting ATPase ATPase C chain
MKLVPIDLVTQSGSGTDPDISVTSALLQIPRISNLTGISQSRLTALVDQYTENPTFGVFGEPRVNVLQLNLALDGLMNATALHVAEIKAAALNATATNATT